MTFKQIKQAIFNLVEKNNKKDGVSLKKKDVEFILDKFADEVVTFLKESGQLKLPFGVFKLKQTGARKLVSPKKDANGQRKVIQVNPSFSVRFKQSASAKETLKKLPTNYLDKLNQQKKAKAAETAKKTTVTKKPTVTSKSAPITAKKK